MAQVRVIPKKGLRVRDPKTALPLPPDGKEVDFSVYWHRCAERGDVTIEANASATEPTKLAAKKRGQVEE